MNDADTSPTSQDVLTRAAEIIVRRGRTTQQYWDDTGAVCTGYAVWLACGHDWGTLPNPAQDLPDSRYDAARAELWRRVGGYAVATWNDDPHTTDEDVLRTLRGDP